MSQETTPCIKCPDGITMMLSDDKVLARPPVSYILNYGGDQAQYFKLVAEAAQSVGGELRYGMPAGHADGSLEFPADKDVPEEIYGYQRDGENRRLFRPIWPECIKRMLGVFVRDGVIVVAGKCSHFQAEHFTKPVTLDQCRECSARLTNPIPAPVLRTAEEFIAAAEARAAEGLKKRLGDDIFERAKARAAEARMMVLRGSTPVATDKTASAPSHDGPA